MREQQLVYIALGSNKGDKFKHLQEAIYAIYEKAGTVLQISKIYRTKAYGFDGDDFLNCCISLQTVLSAQELLIVLQEIETKLGRKKIDPNVYEAREIDLDIIFYAKDIVSHSLLTVPHKELHKRLFVLVPLNDIAAKTNHPKLNKTVTELIALCEDKEQPEPQNIWLKNPKQQFNTSKHNYIAIEGNIGAGKTSLASLISEEFNAKLILERFADNPFLPKFYEDAARFAFTLEMSFLADRYQQITDDLAQLDLFSDFMISDYDIFKSLIFSKITLPEDEFNLYKKLFYLMYKDIPKPDLYVYLYQNTERLQENIKKRGRDYEQNIDPEYLDKINIGYLEFLKTQQNFNVKIIDISNRDFIENRSDYLWLLNEIFEVQE
ncbi:2-amino-4-hydroxy-6-hydroxymethyldihydropteridine diphosphokinase [Aurantibacter aestuarii]|uniref:2-amino-4-hydroxy-6-hydroxymethyldihydropteridine pyrophosphokinase n=1 Tax=Aurantibacter aestuarii TaxID=1266046 RepID=A0A2T1NE46_9FLAO|nr:2-amino-4-hydroxy-6-hydroxymethyldihydropteridine diphosphokinase [Aurantibacter aestuarii]PSG90717.1 2-amino-4-hydroxy-6-hydroxymethyldihydropteridine diphosphokinase [Aurantibacter aestuarii]